MPIRVFIANNFDHMSRVAADIVKKKLIEFSRKKKEVVLGLATGNSPTGMYKYLAQAANNNEFDSSHIRSFNLDDMLVLPEKMHNRSQYTYKETTTTL